jgi:hypothetical protein
MGRWSNGEIGRCEDEEMGRRGDTGKRGKELVAAAFRLRLAALGRPLQGNPERSSDPRKNLRNSNPNRNPLLNRCRLHRYTYVYVSTSPTYLQYGDNLEAYRLKVGVGDCRKAPDDSSATLRNLLGF